MTCFSVTQFIRNAKAGGFSVERLYSDVRAHLSKEIDVRVIENRYRSRGFLRRLIDALRAALHQGDVNHVTGDVHYLTFFLRKRRTLLTILDCVALERYAGFKRLIFWFFWFWLPVRRSSVVVTISEATRQQVIGHCNCAPEKVRVVHCTLSDAFEPAPGRPQRDRPRILHIGTARNKNLDGHVKALQNLDCTLVIIGRLSTDQKDMLDQSRIEYENLMGVSEQALVEQYRMCDLLLFASLYEGFGLPIIEAQAVGRPVITSDRWSMPEVAGGAALLVDPDKPGEIRTAVIEIMSNPSVRTELVNSGLKNCCRFAPGRIAEQYDAIYRELGKPAAASGAARS